MYCSYQKKYSNIGFSEVNKKRILEAKALKEELKRDSHHELQCSSIPEIFSDSHGTHIDPCYKKYLWNYFSWLAFRCFQRYACLKFVVFLFRRSSSSQVPPFQLNGCILAYNNSQKQLTTAFLKKPIFLQYLIIELTHEVVNPVKDLQVQSSLKINSVSVMFLKSGDWIRL